MPDVVVEKAPAKINLALHVGPLRNDGFHPVVTLMVAVEGLYDTVTVHTSAERRVDCAGMGGPDNLAWKALDALSRALDRPINLHVQIDKAIPSPAGLGGGSSDAAATLRAARRVLGLDVSDKQLEHIAAHVGSDVPFFVRGGAQWATGRGEVLHPATTPCFWGVVTRPVGKLATGRVYRVFDGLCRPHVLGAQLPELTDWATSPAARNDLWPAALAVAPSLGRRARALHAVGARRVLLCGSGGAMVGLWHHEDAARRAAAQLGDDALAVVRSGES